VFLSDRKAVQNSEDALDDLDWWVGAVRILADPHLQESASVHLQEDLLNMLLLEELSHLFTKLETIQSRFAVFDGLIVKQAGVVHSLDQVDGDSFGLFFEDLLGLEGFLSSICDVLAANYLASAFDSSELGQ